jgi:RNA polymerase sigma-70 factor (ECF subfamily)
MDAARNGDKEAQGRLLEAFRRPLLRLARRQLGARVQAKGGASDLVQDTLVKALHDIGAFQGCTPAQVMEWLRAILMHTTNNFVRRFTTGKRQIGKEKGEAARSLTNNPRYAEPSASERAIYAERLSRLRACVDRLPTTYAEVIHLRFEAGKSYEEVGARTGRTDEAARKLLTRAVESLAGALAQDLRSAPPEPFAPTSHYFFASGSLKKRAQCSAEGRQGPKKG